MTTALGGLQSKKTEVAHTYQKLQGASASVGEGIILGMSLWGIQGKKLCVFSIACLELSTGLNWLNKWG